MTRLVLIFVAIAALVQAADPVDAVRTAAAGWRQGTVKQDQSALDRFLADDLVYAHGGGKTQSKAEYIAEVTKGPSHYESFSESDINIRFYGKTAVLTGFVDVKPTKGEPYRVRTLEVYLEKGGRLAIGSKGIRSGDSSKRIHRGEPLNFADSSIRGRLSPIPHVSHILLRQL